MEQFAAGTTTTSEPGLLLIEVDLSELLWGFREINNSLNESNHLHHKVSSTTGWNAASKTDNEHDDARIIISKDKLMDTQATEEDSQEAGGQFFAADF
jgi:hypothetical protein